MNKKISIWLLLVLINFIPGIILAQTPKLSFVLTNNESGITRTYLAKDYITLKPGFSYKANSTAIFNAKVNSALLFTTAVIKNPTPGDTSNTSEDKIYIAGNSLASDNPSPVPGINSIIFKNDGTIINDNSKVLPIAWFKTVPVTNNLNGAYKWKDMTNNANLFKYSTQGAGHGLEYVVTRDKVRSYNFNPAIDLSYGNISKEILLNNVLAQTTIMGVWAPREAYETNKYMFSLYNRYNQGVLFTKQTVVEADSSKDDFSFGSISKRTFLFHQGASVEANVNDFREKSLRIGTYYKANKPTTSIWGEKQKAVLSLGNKFDSTNVNYNSRFDANWQNFDAFRGYTPELLVFDRQLSPNEYSVYQSYLAIKYGVSLDTFYISPNRTILWDYNDPTNIIYKNRITGYGREDAIGLNQKTSTTSYEELPCYSDSSLFDSYDQNNSYGKSNRSRLLVIGSQPGNVMNDGTYVLFGDNGGAITTVDSLIVGFKAAMPRKWLVCNTPKIKSETDKILNWTNTGFTININTDYKSRFSKAATTSPTPATLLTQKSLIGKDGYLAWDIDGMYGPLFVKFGTNLAALSTTNSNDYGFQISKEGWVYSIIKGIVGTELLIQVENGQRLEIEKNGDVIFMRINGVRYKVTEITIDPSQSNMVYYGAISVGTNDQNMNLTNFRHGGFVDTGNRVELSYSPQRASGFAYNSTYSTYLIIDRSGTGNFSGAIDFIKSDEYDAVRSKIIFNNVFWDTNNNGSDAFTFGYGASTILRSSKVDDPENPLDEMGTNDIQIYYKDMSASSTVTVRVQTKKPAPATILLYDLVGRRIDKIYINQNSEIQYADVKLPCAGVFIIKVITNQIQYSRQVISRE